MPHPTQLRSWISGGFVLTSVACGASRASSEADAGAAPTDSAVPDDATLPRDAGTLVSDATISPDNDAAVVPAAEAGAARDASGSSPKKGFGLASSSGFGDAQLSAIGAAWYYDWGASPVAAVTSPFVPMIFSPADVTKSISGPIVLGFNEPDNANQANISVDAAVAVWPAVVAKAVSVGAPAMAGNPVTGTWFPSFMDAGPKIDFIPMHWYKGATSAKFIADVTAVINAYHVPVWLTEFAPQTAAESQATPTQYSQAQVNQFVAESVAWMEQQPEVVRYAWHDSRVGTSALYFPDGGLTPTGTAYAAAR